MKVGIVFSGYGSQYIGMGKDAYDASRIVQEYFEEAYNCLGLNFVKLCFASSDQELAQIESAYLALFVVNVSLYALLAEECLLEPDLVAGHGVGRYAAIFAAKGFSFPDALYILKKFTSFYLAALDEKIDAQVLYVAGVSLKRLQELCDEVSSKLTIAISNSDVEQYVTGPASEFAALQESLQELRKEIKGIRFKEVSLGFGLHSSLMDAVARELETYLEKIDVKDLQIPFVSSVQGKILTSKRLVKKEIVQQINHPLQWNKVVSAFKNCDTIIEVGAGKRLAALFREQYPDKHVFTCSNLEEIKALKLFFEQHKSVSRTGEKL